MLKKTLLLIASLVLLVGTKVWAFDAYQTDDLYRGLIKSVEINDFDLMAAQYHRDAVLVSKKKTELISDAIKRWRVDGAKLYQDGGKAKLRMRFKDRKVNDSTAYETGVYHYRTVDKDNKVLFEYYMNFADLNVKVNGKWQMIMERNVKRSTPEEFNALPEWH